MTMLELLVVLALSAGLAASLIGWWNWRSTSQRDDLAAQHAKVVLRAAQSYIRNNYATLYNNAASGPVSVAASSMELGDGMATTNAYGQTFVLRMIRNGTSLEGLVLYTGGQTIKISSLRAIANEIGLAGGYVSTDEPNTAVGMMRQWTKALAAYGGNTGTGKVAVGLFVEEMAQAADDYLHRTATNGKPELNRMSTAIDMNGNNLNSAGAVTANSAAVNGVTVSDGGLATAALSIAKASFGSVPYPYETIQYNPAYNLRIYQGSTQRMVFDGDGISKFSGGVTSNTNILAQNDVTAGGTLSAQYLSVNEAYAGNWFRVRGGGGVYWEQFGGGWYMGDSTWIRAYNNKNIYTAGEIRGGSLSAEGRMTSNDVMLNRIETAGTGCGENGLQARTDAGAPLSCVSGTWRQAGGASGGYYVYRGRTTGASQTISGANNSGYTSHIVFYTGGPAGNQGAKYFVNGVMLGYSAVYDRDWASYGGASFPVPPGGTWAIQAVESNYSTTYIYVYEYIQQ
jgi:type II secretory pathway pseudopilin PulG